jgi:hypothetical protein
MSRAVVVKIAVKVANGEPLPEPASMALAV